MPSEIDDSHMLSIIQQEMCVNDRNFWSRDLEKTSQPATLLGPMTWMTAEMKSRMRATALLRTGSSNDTIHHVYVIAGSGSENKSSSHRCWICKTQAHCTENCQNVLALNPEERINIAQANHDCFSCLKRAGKDHRLTTWSQRRRCTEAENGIQCRQYQHSLLLKLMTSKWLK